MEDKEGIKKGSANTLVTTDVDNSSNNIITSKRTKNKKRREVQQEFTHPWLIGALKGHTDLVLDIDFSSNNKYLASCAQGMFSYINKQYTRIIPIDITKYILSGLFIEILNDYTNTYKLL